MSQPPRDLSDPAQAREHAMDLFRSYAHEIFRKTRWTRVTLCVAQYWDDEANDAVHELMVADLGEGAPWPHHCPDWETRDTGPPADSACAYCSRDLDWLRGWHDNGWAIRAFEPWCREGATQNDEHVDAYLPYAIATPVGTVGVEIEVVGKPVRPWLLELEPLHPAPEEQPLLAEVFRNPASDVPRQVFADWLQERGEPRGRFIAEQLAGNDASALLHGNELAWAGEIATVCDASRTVFRRGFPAEVRVCFPTDEAATLAASDAWATIERLEWHPESRIVWPDLPMCTRMHGVPVDALPMLGDLLAQIEELSVTQLDEQAHGPLAVLHQAPALRSLRLARGARASADLPWWRLHRLEVTSRDVEDWLALAREHVIDVLIVDGAVRTTWSGDTLVFAATKYGWANHEAQLAEVARYRAWLAANGPSVRASHDGLHRGDELVEAFDGG